MATELQTEKGRQLCHQLEQRIQRGMTPNDLKRKLISHLAAVTSESSFLTDLFVHAATTESGKDVVSSAPFFME